MPAPWRDRLIQFACALIVLAMWAVVADAWPSARFLISSPAEVGTELVRLIRTGDAFRHAAITGAEALAGLLCGAFLGVVIGLVLWFSPRIESLTRPFVVAAGAFPVFALAPLMLVWFGVGFLMKVVLAGLAVFFVSFGQATRGTREAREYEAVLQAMGATKREIFRIVVIPGSLGWVLNSLRLSIGLALLGAFIGEFISSSAGLGYVLLRASSLYAVGRAIAAGLCIVALAVLLDWIAGQLEAYEPHIAQALSVSSEFRR